MGRIILVTGGASSGKSEYAEKICSQIEEKTGKYVLYIATGVAFDDEMKLKKERHIKRRKDKNWSTLEAYKNICDEIEKSYSNCGVLILDCITMLISNHFFEENLDFESIGKDVLDCKKMDVLAEIDSIIEYSKEKGLELILVTNEIGLGVLPMEKLSRYFMEAAGEANKMIAKKSDDVYLVVSGIPVKIK